MALECMRDKWTTMADDPRYELVREGIQARLAKLSKWYKAIEATDLYFICIGKSVSMLRLLTIMLNEYDM